MDLVRELKEVRFELSLRGYDCEAVDAFLAKLRGDVSSVQSKHDDAQARIAELEGMVQDGGGSSETEGTLRRTLVLAQRLADETEAESKKAAADLIDSATAEAESLRSKATTDAESMRETAEAELKNARDEAEKTREATNEDAAKGRIEARQQAEAILAEAERRSVERVAVIEQTAQEEAAKMRNPVRSEIGELEGVRSNLLADISALETHLEQQRVRVRTAVEALRVGMSGSIEDLERVAEDDELLATQPAPAHSGASADAVEQAPEIEIVDRVEAAAPAPPTVDDVEDAAIASLVDDPVSDVVDADVDVISHVEPEHAIVEGTAVAADPAVTEEVIAEEVVAEVVVEEDVVEQSVVEQAAVAEEVVADDGDVFAEVAPENVTGDAPVEAGVEGVAAVEDVAVAEDSAVEEVAIVEDDGGPKTQPIPVVALLSDDELENSEVVVLDDEPSALFETDLGADADVTEIDDQVVAEPPAAVVEEVAAEPEVEAANFVSRFAAALDELPISRKG